MPCDSKDHQPQAVISEFVVGLAWKKECLVHKRQSGARKDQSLYSNLSEKDDKVMEKNLANGFSPEQWWWLLSGDDVISAARKCLRRIRYTARWSDY